MSQKILVPTLGESVTEATVAKWLKVKGDKVISDEPLVELETDKVNVEVPAPSNGVLETISVEEGETVNVGALLGIITSSKNIQKKDLEEKEEQYKPPIKNEKPISVTSKKNDQPLVLEKIKQPKIYDEEPLVLDKISEPNKFKQTRQTSEKISVTEKAIAPSARKIASEANIDLSTISGTGKNGLVLKEDVLGLMGIKPKPSERKITHGPEERIKMTRLRMTIAKRLKEAQENAAMLTTFNEVDMHEIISMRNKYKNDFQEKT